MEYSFSETFLIEVGSLIILTLFLIVSKIKVDEIYSRLKGGSCLINTNLHLERSNFLFFKILKKLFFLYSNLIKKPFAKTFEFIIDKFFGS